MTGLEHANGQLVFLIDVDLEKPPGLLDAFYQKLEEGDWDGWISVMASVWILGGWLVLLSIGVVGLYVSRISV